MSDPAHAQRLAAYVGPNADLYLRKWAELERGGSMSWNFAAFFLGPFWLAYRKMLVPALIVVALFFGIFLLETLGGVQGASLFSALVSLGVGLYGNRAYRDQAERAVAVSGGDPARLHAAGGVSLSMAIGLAVAFVLLTGVSLKLMQEGDAGPFERSPPYRPYGGAPIAPGGATPSAPNPNSGAPAQAGAVPTPDYLVGRWSPTGNCAAPEYLFNADGTGSRLGRAFQWRLEGNRLVVGAPDGSPGQSAAVTIIDQGHMGVVGDDPLTLTRC